MIDIVKSRLAEAGYRIIGVNYPGAQLYFTVTGNGCYVVNILDYRNPVESQATIDGVEELNESVKKFLAGNGYENVRILTLIATYSEYIAEDFADNRIDYWVLDVYHNTFIIPQGQPPKFFNLDYVLELALDDIEGSGRKTEAYYQDDSYEPQKTSVRSNEGIPRFNLFMVNNLMVLINIIVFIWLESMGSTTDPYFMQDHGALSWTLVKIHGEFYRFFTCMFIHFGAQHLISNMFVLFVLGDNLERAVGKVKYLIIYLGTGLISSVVSCIYHIIKNENVLSGGASGAIFGVVGALIYVLWRNNGWLEHLSIYRLGFFAVYIFYTGFSSTGIDNAAHVGGFFAGLIMGFILYRPKKDSVVETDRKMY